MGAQNARQRTGSRKEGVGGKAVLECDTRTPWIAGLSPSMDGWSAPMGRDITCDNRCGAQPASTLQRSAAVVRRSSSRQELWRDWREVKM